MIFYFSGHNHLRILILFITVLSISCSDQKSTMITSPDGRISVTLNTNGSFSKDRLTYVVAFNDQPLLEESPLGFEMADGLNLGSSFRILNVEDTVINEEYSMPFGKSSRIKSLSKQQTVFLQDNNGNRLDLVFRLFNDGVAFRYYFPDHPSYSNLEIIREITGFRFKGDPTYWGLHLDSYTTSYEKEYTEARISEIPDTSLIALPVLIRVNEEAWVAVTEAALYDYAGMYLQPLMGHKRFLTTMLSPRRDGSGIKVKSRGSRYTPWRVLMIAEDPGRLVESNIVFNLNDPSKLDFSWVKPGTAQDDWSCDQTVKGTGWEGAMDTRTMKHFIDFCADYGIDYMSIDAGWYGLDWSDTTLDLTKPIPEIDIPYLVEYANEKGVDVFLWTLSTLLKKQIDEVIPLFKKWGIRGFNVDFFDSDDQETVNVVNSIVKKAAENQLMVEFHGIYKPTGISRTYPNLLAHEAVLGLEYYKWDSIPTPEHNCIVPFTRMLAGPMDYIVVGFTNKTPENYKIVWDEFNCLGTRCHQLAQLILFETGFQVLGDYPDNYRNNIGSALFPEITVAWDETKVLHAEVGDYISIARRKGSEWFIGTITDWTPRELEISLNFLQNDKYMVEMYSDSEDAGQNPQHAVLSEFMVKQEDTLRITMVQGGGNVMHLVPTY
jgi:alpha-glucosidase